MNGSWDESQLGEVMNEAWHMLPLLCMVLLVEDGYGRSCRFSLGISGLMGGLIVSKLEPSISGSLPRKVVRDALYKPSFLEFGERCGFSFLVGPIVSTTPIFGS